MLHASIIQCFSAYMLQCFSVAVLELHVGCFGVSVLRRFLSVLGSFNVSVLQCFSALVSLGCRILSVSVIFDVSVL